VNAGRRTWPSAHELTATCVVVSVKYAVHEAHESVPARRETAQGGRYEWMEIVERECHAPRLLLVSAMAPVGGRREQA
jgi:hypothetical protein